MAWETGVQSQVKSYQRLKKWYLMPPCLTLIIIRYRSRVKWSNPGKGLVPSTTPQCSSYWKGSLWVTLDYGQLLYIYIYNHCVVLTAWNLLQDQYVNVSIPRIVISVVCGVFDWQRTVFVSASHQIGLDTRSMTQRSA